MLGHSFLIRTDHAALQWLKRTPEPIGQQARWLEILEEYNYEIQHRPGRLHCNADGVSRRPPQEDLVAVAVEDSDRNNAESNFDNQPGSYDWLDIQQSDPDINFVRNLVSNDAERPEPNTLTARSGDVKTLCSQLELLTIRPDGVLCRKWTKYGREHL